VRGRSVEVRLIRKRAFLSLVSTLALVLSTAASTTAASVHRQVEVLDDCNAASFDAALGDPNACVKLGGTTFSEFISELVAMGRAPAWRFAPADLTLPAGGSIDAYNRGGEFHTFTEVAAFGGGCVQPLNQILGLTAVPECANAGVLFASTGIAPGGELETAELPTGTHRFQCLIHPWMRSTVVVP
jgi:plastocyanin